MDGISDDLKYYLKSMPFSRTTQRISPLSSSSGVGLGDSIVFRMPLGSILDLKTFGVMFDMTPTAGGSNIVTYGRGCLLYTSPSPRDRQKSRMPSSA